MAQSKRIKKQTAKFDVKKLYSAVEAIALARTLATKKFDETLEVHLKLGIDPKKGDQQVRSTVVLPHTFGKSKIVAAFVTEDLAKEAKDAGADIVYTESDIPELQKSGKIEFEIAVAVPGIMKNLAPLARTLGTKGLMPSPKNETITTNLAKTVGELKKGKIAFKNDDTANIHQAVGKLSQDDKQLLENFTTFIDSVKRLKPESAKGVFVKNVTLCTTMGPGIKIEIK
ncbi:MAG: 50S ribosomal protein L1 [Parcubacteria group bacterium GW2011_GWC2_38_7]|nr:MAG: 50S ribosomal protein L1 [Parcubacteria group bacterium GW2011_GWC2_38_7]